MTEMIAFSVKAQRQLARKLDLFLFGLEETKKNLELENSTVLRRLKLDTNSASMLTSGSAGIVPIGSSLHSE